jgi:hypothetical protein
MKGGRPVRSAAKPRDPSSPFPDQGRRKVNPRNQFPNQASGLTLWRAITESAAPAFGANPEFGKRY